MDEHFVFDGKEVEDNILFYWSIASISRALRFHAEAQHQKGTSVVLATVAGYYSLFHLGMFLLNSAPQIMNAKLRVTIGEELKKGTRDPSRAVHHKALLGFLEECGLCGLPLTIVELFKKAKELREFVNYGPDLLTTPEGFRFFNREYYAQEAIDVLDGTGTAFVEAVVWVCHNESDSKGGIPIALSKAADSFLPNEYGAAYYSEWSSQEVLSRAETLRRLLHQRAQELVYPMGEQPVAEARVSGESSDIEGEGGE